MPHASRKPSNVGLIFRTTGSECATRSSGPGGSVPQVASSRRAASRSSGAASKSRACIGASPERMPSWPSGARSRADATSRSGNVKPDNGQPEWKHAT